MATSITPNSRSFPSGQVFYTWVNIRCKYLPWVGQDSVQINRLAFQRQELREYVDPTDQMAMRNLCKKIGLQIAKDRPLGTNDVASTIVFEHSIPRAVLPVLIFGGAKVKAHDGTVFEWKPLVTSQHVAKPARSDKDVHCDNCPLVRDEQAARAAQAAQQTQAAQPAQAA